MSILFFLGILPFLCHSMPAFSETVRYAYDNLGRLSNVYYGNGMTAEYMYDTAGNRRSFMISEFAISDEHKITADDGAADDHFGTSVAISGEYAIVGADGDDDHGSSSGAAYIFHWDGSRWVQHSKLLPDDGTADAYFGDSVAISGDNALVGAYGHNSAYMFTWDESTWSQQTRLTSSGQFGWSVAMSGEYAIIGAPLENANGAAVIFYWDGNSWTQQATLTATDGAADDRFGCSVVISGEYAVVGAEYDDDAGDDSGSAYIFQREGSQWTQQAKLTAADGATSDWFGSAVSMSDEFIIVGASGDDDNGSESGSAYLFTWDGSAWSQQAKLTPDDGVSGDSFGDAVSISGDLAIVGADGDDDHGSASGSAYIFRWNGSHWIQEVKLTAGDATADDQFGMSVAASKDHVIVGAVGDDEKGYNSGSAYIYEVFSVNREPDMLVKDGETPLPDGGMYDFGSVEPGSNATATFTIENTGRADLLLTGDPRVAISGEQVSDFIVTSPQPSSPLAPGSSVQVDIQFTPTAPGERTATVSIANNDVDENPYTVVIGNALSVPSFYILWTY